MNIQDQMRLNSVKRWGIVATARPQSVAEHTFNVLLIYREICKRYGNILMTSHMVQQIIDHDMDEVLTGDIPSPRKPPPNFDDMTDVQKVMKAADMIESYCFIVEYGRGRHAHEVQHWLRSRLCQLMGSIDDPDLVVVIREVQKDILEGELAL